MKMKEYIESELSGISRTGCQKYGACVSMCVCGCMCVCACVCMCVSAYVLSLYRILVTEQSNKCNAGDQVRDGILRKYHCVKNLCHHVIDNHSRDPQDSNCAKECQLNRVESREVKVNLINFPETNIKSAKHSYLPPL